MTKMRIQNFSKALSLSAAALLFSLPANAAVRTAYFSQNGQNRTVKGISQDTQSTCSITISNPSTQSQQVSLAIVVSSLDSWVSATASQPGGAPVTSGAGMSCTGFTCSGTLSASGTFTATWSYTSFPKRSMGTASGANDAKTQQLRCSGSLTVTDVTNPGFILASGTLVTFVESSQLSTDASTGGSRTFGGIPVFTKTQIVINRGKGI